MQDTITTGDLQSAEVFAGTRSVVCDVSEPSPHLRKAARTTQRIMVDVVIALTPAIIGSIFLFGPAVLIRYISSILAGFGTSIFIQLLQKRPVYSDISAAVTGLLFAMSMPSTAPIWFFWAGPAFGLIVAKELFGGIGRNFLNPALTGRALFRLVFPSMVLKNPWPNISLYGSGPDILARSTPLMRIKEGISPSGQELLDSFLGFIGGKMGETSALLLLLGAIYLVARGVIRLRIPFATLSAMALMAWVLGGPNGLFTGTPAMVLGHLLGGATILGVFFMATDYSSSPTDPRAQYIFGIGLGILIMLWRFYSPWAEGFTFALLTMNLTVPLFNRFMRPRVLGESKQNKHKAKSL